MKSISIVTVNFNQHELNIDFLKSIKQNPSVHPLEVIFVDNGSLNQYEAEYRSIYPELIYIRSEQNLGFAGGNNIGIRAAKGDYLLLLNNDTEITPNFIDLLASELKNNQDIGLISPLILYFDQPQIIQYAGFTEMNYLTCRNTAIGILDVDKGQFDKASSETGYCHGAAMMCRRTDLEQIGMMAEEFFLYYEELDWCERFKKAGKKIWFTGKAKIYHKESMSVGKQSSMKTYFMTRNRMLFIRKNTSLLNTIFFSIYFILIVCTRDALMYWKNKRSDLITWMIKGVLWNFMHKKNSKNLGFKI